jgi:hypothetical protein
MELHKASAVDKVLLMHRGKCWMSCKASNHVQKGLGGHQSHVGIPAYFTHLSSKIQRGLNRMEDIPGIE